MFWVSLLATFSNFTCFFLCFTILILSCTQEHFHLAEDISIEMANIVFDKAMRKVIKDVVKHAYHVSAALYYSQLLKHSLYLIINYYLITTFVVLVIGAEAVDKAQSGMRHLLDQGATPSREV
jgi:hypothetical protein